LISTSSATQHTKERVVEQARILIVEDAREFGERLKRRLENAHSDWNVISAADADEACAVVERWQPDVVLCDLVLTEEVPPPEASDDLGGMVVLKRAKALDPLRPVVLYTTKADRMQRYRAFELGAYDCIEGGPAGLTLGEELSVKADAALRLRRAIEASRKAAILKRYFDPRVLRQIEDNPDLLKLRTATVTVCFWDIRNFAGLCKVLNAHPALIHEFLRNYFAMAAEVIFEHGGVLDKFIGDGVMGLFGALVDSSDKGAEDARRAVTAACAMRRRFAKLLEQWKREWELYEPDVMDIGLGCGIHTGDVLVGNVGADPREEYTALGAHVNFAQRIVGMAEKGEIRISNPTATRLGDEFRLVDKGIITNIKHIEGSFQIWEVQGRR
jgi:adenylate cyclase